MTDQDDARAAYAAWLCSFLPSDYYERYSEYRFDLELRRRYQRAAFEEGWLLPEWPRGLGGRELGHLESLLVKLEAAQRSAPKLPCVQAVGVVAPSLRQFGTTSQKEMHLVPTLRGDYWWALGMSEPNAGSDLASLRTTATPIENGFVINGQKTWTTQAHVSPWCLLFARTDSQAPKHKGISCFLLDLHAPGVTVRPIEMAMETDEVFCEVFLENVEVPQDALLGAREQGWSIAMASLSYEREMIWIMNSVEIYRALTVARDAMEGRSVPLAADIGRLLTDATAMVCTGFRTVRNEELGRPATESYIQKLLGSESLQRTWEIAAAAKGAQQVTDRDLIYYELESLAATMYGGTSEIQRNIISERVLGLPK